VQALVELAHDDDRTVLLTADLGFMALEPFSDTFPDRYYNVGVSEQNMIGMATGLAEAGYRPYCYSIAPFAALRPFEFIRNGPVHHRLPVRVVGVGGGFEYAHAGASHHGIDDIGALRTQAGLVLVSPADAAQTATAMRAVHDLDDPVYLRIGKDDRRVIAGLDGRFRLGRLEILRQGRDVLLVGMGSITSEVVEAAEELSRRGIDSSVAVAASIAPAPTADLFDLTREHSLVVTVEAHRVVNGLGSLVAEVIADGAIACRLVRLGVREASSARSGSENYLNHLHGIDAASVVATVESELRR
jgi:transketolase